MIGAGIFVLPGPATALAGPAVAFAFVIGGVISIFTAMSASELGTAMPKAGGSYDYVNHALGPIIGSIAGLGNWMGLAFASAFYAIGFGSYVAGFLPDLAFSVGVFPLTNSQIYALSAGALFVAINYIGAKETGRLQNVIVLTLVSILIVFIAIGDVKTLAKAGSVLHLIVYGLLILGATEQGLLTRLTRGTGPLEVIRDLQTSVLLVEKAHDRSFTERLFG